ncbi:MAG: anthrone oxygenase family protein [Vicinamibacterales bacterium]
MKILQLLSVMLFALVTGVFWGTWFSLSRSIDTITPATFLEVGHIMISNLGGPMSILLPASILSAVPIMYVLYRRGESSAFVLATIAVALMLAALTVTLLVNVPLDDRFAVWTIATLPPDWRVSRDRWEFYHGVRTLLSVASLSSLVGSVLVSRDPSGTVAGRSL